jgi:hypothetical protein
MKRCATSTCFSIQQCTSLPALGCPSEFQQQSIVCTKHSPAPTSQGSFTLLESRLIASRQDHCHIYMYDSYTPTRNQPMFRTLPAELSLTKSLLPYCLIPRTQRFVKPFHTIMKPADVPHRPEHLALTPTVIPNHAPYSCKLTHMEPANVLHDPERLIKRCALQLVQ